ncbi:hypothetical protein SASPL_146081 [Salvia splendens]|uniref:Uncharacterized protein n=1 Tax=Salvia splendens TaxID=180675 RepID=A0A8X8WIR1_SALSN|nr:uncharacterized protein LOC121775570 [Salvia splendens]XP_042028592.1 uncharacterized protein LOC121775570 [Salvia splendens]XP_042028593.1 uncharacterized protein LOC121775570 [Salvia splendens]KAG6395436.1 hypothetical protein SASPL_146081 [Salvia splendens]
MRLKPVSPAADCSFQPSSYFRTSETDGPLPLVFASKTLLKSRSFTKISRGSIRRSCSLNIDDKPSFHVEAMSSSLREEEGSRRKKRHCAISNKKRTIGSATPFLKGGRDQDSFLESRFDFLEPMMLGIRPEFPEWPDRETAAWAMVEHKANSFDIPLSLRMIKKKLQLEEGSAEAEEGEGGCCSVKAAFASMVFIIVEMQSSALHMREALCDEDLDVIKAKVQKEMHLSFVWLFQHVFSRTPALMLHVMVLLADFSVHSTSLNTAIGGEASLMGRPYEHGKNSSLSMVDADRGLAVEENTERESGDPSIYPSNEFKSSMEMQLWDSMVDEANHVRGGGEGEVVLDHDVMKYFVSPVSVEIEPDTYQDFYRTDLLYQMYLSLEPNNTLLLLNYARFLQLVTRDYQRSEECFKRAVQVTPPDGESFSEYANFLWTVKKDYWAAEESFLQALALEPHNTHFASRYANFLWSTGGEETCFPLNT